MCLSFAAARKYVLIICIRLLAVISMCLLMVICTRAIFQIQIKASLSDEDAVYLHESAVKDHHICMQEGMFPYCLQGTSTYTRRQNQ